MDRDFPTVKTIFKMDIKKLPEHTKIKTWSFYWTVSMSLKENNSL